MSDDAARAHLPTLAYQGALIAERGEMLSLTDMWKAAGSPADKRPAEWRRYEGAAFVTFLTESLNVGSAHIWFAQRGAGGATFAHWQIALAYAKYLSPAFHAWCNTVVRDRMQGMVTPRGEIALVHDIGPEARKAIGGIVKRVLPALLAEALAKQHAVVHGITAGQVLEMAGFSARVGLRGLAAWVSRRLQRFHAQKGVALQMAILGSRSAYVFSPVIVREWLAAGGRTEIEKKVAERRGQGRLRLVQPAQCLPEGAPP